MFSVSLKEAKEEIERIFTYDDITCGPKYVPNDWHFKGIQIIENGKFLTPVKITPEVIDSLFGNRINDLLGESSTLLYREKQVTELMRKRTELENKVKGLEEVERKNKDLNGQNDRQFEMIVEKDQIITGLKEMLVNRNTTINELRNTNDDNVRTMRELRKEIFNQKQVTSHMMSAVSILN